MAAFLALSGGSSRHALVVETISINLTVLLVEDGKEDVGLGLPTLVRDGLVRHAFETSRGQFAGALVDWNEAVVLMHDLQSRDDVLLNGSMIRVDKEGGTVLFVCVFIQSFDEACLGLVVEIEFGPFGVTRRSGAQA